MRETHGGEHDRADPGPERRAVARVLAGELLLSLEQGEHASRDRRLRCVVVPEVARQAGEGERLVAGPSHQHAPDGDHEDGRQPLEQEAVREPPRAGSRPEVERLLACEQPLGLATEDPGQLLVRKARLEAESHGHRRGHERREVREVAPEQELARAERTRRGQRDRPGCHHAVSMKRFG